MKWRSQFETTTIGILISPTVRKNWMVVGIKWGLISETRGEAFLSPTKHRG